MSEEMYCPDCGSKMEETKAKWYCPDCGFRVPKPAPDLSRNFDWDAFRVEAAKGILCAVLSTPGMWTETTYDGLAAACIRQADELIKQLKERE